MDSGCRCSTASHGHASLEDNTIHVSSVDGPYLDWRCDAEGVGAEAETQSSSTQ